MKRISFATAQRWTASWLLVALLISAVSPPAWAQAGSSQVVARHRAFVKEVKGTVEVKSIGQSNWRKATNEMEVRTGDEIRTAEGATCKVQISDVGQVAIAANSKVSVGDLQQVKTTARAFLMFQRAVVRDDVGLNLDNGNLKSNFNRKEGRVGNYNVYTPVAVAGVRGTTFELDLEGGPTWYEKLDGAKGQGENDQLMIIVGEGRVELSGQNWTREVSDGQMLVARIGSTPGNPTNADPNRLRELTGTFAGERRSETGDTTALRNVSSDTRIVATDTSANSTSSTDDFDTPVAISGLTEKLFEYYSAENEGAFIGHVSSYFSGVANNGNQLNYSTLVQSAQFDFRAMSTIQLAPTVNSISSAGNEQYVVQVTWNGLFRFNTTGNEVRQTGMKSTLVWDARERGRFRLSSWTGSAPFGLSDPMTGVVSFSTVEGSTSVDGVTIVSTTTSQTVEFTSDGTASVGGGSGSTLAAPTVPISTGNYVIPVGTTLSLGPADLVQVQGPYSIVVEGTLIANGATITGTGWNGIEFRAGSSGTIDNTTISGANVAITVIGSSPQIRSSTFSNNSQIARIVSGNPAFDGCSFNLSSPGVVIEGGNPSILNSTFSGSGSSDPIIKVTGPANVTLTGNSFSNGGGLEFHGSSGSVSLANSTLSNLLGNAVDLNGGGNVSLSGVTISSPQVDGIEMRSSYSGTLTLSSSNSIVNPGGIGLDINGGGVSQSGFLSITGALGAAALENSSASAQSFDGVSVTGGSLGVRHAGGSTLTFNSSSVGSATTGISVTGGGTLTATSLSLNNNSTGLVLSAGTVSLTSLSLSGGSTGISMSGGAMTLYNSTVSSATTGVALSGGNFTLDGSSGANTIQNNGTGVVVNGGSFGASSSNSVQSNTTSGITFNTTSGAITLSGLSVSSNASDGLLLNGGGTFNVVNGTFSGNGNGIRATSGASGLTISNTSFTSNTNGVRLDGISSATVSGSSFNSNTNGILAGQGASLTVNSSSSFSNNSTAGISATDISSLTLDNLTFGGNGNGIAISSPGGTANLTNVSVSSTVSNGINVTSSSGTALNLNGGNSVSGSGGSYAINLQGGTISTSGSNTISGGSGAAIRFGSAGSGTLGANTTVTNSGGGSGILAAGSGTITLNNPTIQGTGGAGIGLEVNGSSTININAGTDLANWNHGVLVYSTGNLTATNANFTGNSTNGVARSGAGAGNILITQCYFSGNAGGGVETSCNDGSNGSPQFQHGDSPDGAYGNLVFPPDRVTYPAAPGGPY